MSKLANREEKQYQEKLLKISRVSKTTKGGRTISFSVLAAVGDEKKAQELKIKVADTNCRVRKS